MLKLEPSAKAIAYGLSEEFHFTQAEWLKMREVAKERGTLGKFINWQKNKFILIQTTESERKEIISGEEKTEVNSQRPAGSNQGSGEEL